MVVSIKTTVIIDDSVMADLKREAANQRRTMSELIETALREFLRGARRKPSRQPKFPRFHSGGHLVDISDRDALCAAMEKG
jgi:hypothetical protein